MLTIIAQVHTTKIMVRCNTILKVYYNIVSSKNTVAIRQMISSLVLDVHCPKVLRI